MTLNPSSGNYKTLKRRMKELEIIEDFKEKAVSFNTQQFTLEYKSINEKTLEESLIVNSPYISTSNLKKKLLKLGLLKNQCYECCLKDTWRGHELPLDLDHINGNDTDNRLINLRLLCKNCHAVTPTYGAKNKTYKNNVCCLCSKDTSEGVHFCHECIAGVDYSTFECSKIELNALSYIQSTCLNCGIKEEEKFCSTCKEKCSKEYTQLHRIPIHTCKTCNEEILKTSTHCTTCYHTHNRKVERPSKEELEELIKVHTFVAIGCKYGVKDNSVRKWCKSYGLPYTKKQIHTYFSI